MDAVAAERPNLLQALGWSSRDAVAFVVAVAAAILIFVNTLFLQPGPHPAPMVKSSIAAIMPPETVPSPTLAGTSMTLPTPRPPEAPQPKAEHARSVPTAAIPAPTPAPAASARPNTAVVADIQRELNRRGFYDGVVDGRYGPRTDASIRDFEQAAGLKPSTAPDEALLRAIQRSIVRSKAGPRPPASIPQAKPDPIGEMIAPSKQVIAVQRALSEFGYGQIKPTGVVDPETQSAIQKFERERKLPVTGQLSHRVVRELASITGRPLE
ncbi:MAG: peptidoglycan-binding protein [Xanthobacteraceae bacterium]|nr:peptidoglycan-binding protein [Xanthobacteraceae bacterium]